MGSRIDGTNLPISGCAGLRLPLSLGQVLLNPDPVPLLVHHKTFLSGTFHSFNFDKYAWRYLGGYCFRFNLRFSLAEMTERIANAVCCWIPCTEGDLRAAESYG